jgi:hypothetical protein
MTSHELMRITYAMQQVRSSMRGSTPDKRIDAIVETLDALTKWIEKFERDLATT